MDQSQPEAALDQQNRKSMQHQKGSYSFHSAFASDIDSINNDLKDIFPNDMTNKLRHQNNTLKRPVDDLELENQLLQQYVQTTLEELQLETQENQDFVQHKIFNHGRNPSQMEMRDLIELAHQNSTYLDNNPIFDFNYLQENSSNDTKENIKEGNMNRYMEFLEAQKTNKLAQKNNNQLSLNLHQRGPSNLTSSSNDKSSDLDKIRDSHRGLKKKHFQTIKIASFDEQLKPSLRMNQSEIQQPALSSARKSSRADKFRNKDEAYGEIIENVNKKQLQPVMSPLRAKLKSFSQEEIVVKDRRDELNELRSKLSGQKTDKELLSPTKLSNRGSSPLKSIHNGIDDSNTMTKKAFSYQLISTQPKSNDIENQDRQNSSRNAGNAVKISSKAQLLEKRRLAGGSTFTQSKQSNKVGLPPQYPAGRENMFNNTINETKLPSINDAQNVVISMKDQSLHEDDNFEKKSLGAVLRQYARQKDAEEQAKRDAEERDRQEKERLLQNDKLKSKEFTSKYKINKFKQMRENTRGKKGDSMYPHTRSAKNMLHTIENKPFEKIAELEKEKLRIVQEAQEYQIKGTRAVAPIIDDKDLSPASRRRNKFRALLNKYSDDPTNTDEAGRHPIQTEKLKQTTYMRLRELDRLHVRNDDEALEDERTFNALLRKKMKIVNEYLSKVVDNQIKKQGFREEYDRKYGIKRLTEEKQKQKDRLLFDKTLDNALKQQQMLKREYNETMDLCTRVAQTNYIDHLEKKIRDMNDDIQFETVQKNNLSIKQKMYYKEKKILNLESELERNAEKINQILERREYLQKEITLAEPKVEELKKRKDTLREILDDEIGKNENILIAQRLPMFEQMGKNKEIYGQVIEKLKKDIKAKKEEIDVFKKLSQVKVHQLDTIGIKVIKVIKLLKQEKDQKHKKVNEQKIIVDYLEKAMELEKQAEIEHMEQDIKNKFQNQLMSMLFGKLNNNELQNTEVNESSQPNQSQLGEEQMIQYGEPEVQLDMLQISNNNTSSIAEGESNTANFLDGMSTANAQSATHQFKYFDQLIFPEGDKDINDLLELYNMHKFQGPKANNLIDDREAAEEQLQKAMEEQKKQQVIMQQEQQRLKLEQEKLQKSKVESTATPFSIRSLFKKLGNTPSIKIAEPIISQSQSQINLTKGSNIIPNTPGISKQKHLQTPKSISFQKDSFAKSTKR
ncbi:UNKNOWN [Stylonychia lemnae]|uniref:Uncharacterized protein n=1 Tax=Stylonychia lemnae TaxID=5949 RepID=A0A078AU41_STYLE|nr:UNKNOWN [Stylonychia lemnae]|eukprot:CDW85496.1 UNKNOWN [Stylonychia lemnae]